MSWAWGFSFSFFLFDVVGVGCVVLWDWCGEPFLIWKGFVQWEEMNRKWLYRARCGGFKEKKRKLRVCVFSSCCARDFEMEMGWNGMGVEMIVWKGLN